MPTNHPAVRNGRFTGLDEVSPAEQVALDAMTVATNVDVDRHLKVSRRPGYVESYSGSVSALWGDGSQMFFAADGQLRSLNEGVLGAYTTAPEYLHGAASPIGTILTSGQEMWVKPDHQVLRGYGMTSPDTPVVTQVLSGGAFRAGRVRLACTLTWPGRGESGASEIISVMVTEGSRLSVQLPASSYTVRLYLSSEDGTELFLHTAAVGGATIAINAPSRHGNKILSTAFSGLPAQPARTLVVDNGRLLYAEHDVLWYSEAYAFERFRLDQNFIPFPAPINLLAPADGGLYVGTEDAHYFLGGGNIANASQDKIANYGAALSQPSVVLEHQHNFENVNDEVSVWLTQRGLVAGLGDGVMLNLSEDKVNLGAAKRGSVGMRRTAAMNQLLFCVRS